MKLSRPNEVWSIDFVMDSLANARRPKRLAVADDFTHDITVDSWYLGGDYAVRVLEQAARLPVYPCAIRTWCIGVPHGDVTITKSGHTIVEQDATGDIRDMHRQNKDGATQSSNEIV